MGLFANVEHDALSDVLHRDLIPDTNSDPSNLMFNSELGGTELTDGQRFVLTRSPALK